MHVIHYYNQIHSNPLSSTIDEIIILLFQFHSNPLSSMMDVIIIISAPFEPFEFNDVLTMNAIISLAYGSLSLTMDAIILFFFQIFLIQLNLNPLSSTMDAIIIISFAFQLLTLLVLGLSKTSLLPPCISGVGTISSAIFWHIIFTFWFCLDWLNS